MANGEAMSMGSAQPDPRKRKYDLEERTARFGEMVIAFAKKVPRTPITIPLIGQLVDAGTSVGANYCEAADGLSKRDFRKSIGICRKEPHESKHWVRMIVAAEPQMKQDGIPVWQEAKELNLIFSRIFMSSGPNEGGS